MMNRNSTFGAIVKERRYHLGLTQAELARRVSCAAITIRKIEANALRPSVQIAEQLAIALNIPQAEQLAFVRLARTDPDPSPLPPPQPVSEEIGQADLTGRAIKGFELGQRLGTGGYGVVYRATQAAVGREVAVKIILPKYADRPEFIRRFEAEAQLVARLEHPHIVPLYDYWREPGVAYLVMRLLQGGSLEDNLKDGPLAPDTILHVLEQICTGLYAAHRAGVVHRDIKPANVLLDQDGNAYLADFGIAKHTGNGKPAEITIEGTIVGSPAYISPEQILTEPVKPQTDIYSMGVMLYELLTGQKPFKGPTPFAYIQQHLNQPLPLLAAVQRTSMVSQTQASAAFEVPADQTIPTALDIVIARATAKESHNRYPDILSMLADIRRAMAPDSTSAIIAGSQQAQDMPPHVAAMLELPELENPYKGLRPFTEADAANFFGRETLIQDLLARMAEQNDLARFLAVVGPSGSGKSSVVRAGLIPALRKGGLPDSEKWFITEMLPGSHPFEELEAALLRVAVNPPESLLAQLRKNERGLLRAVHRILPAAGASPDSAAESGTDLVLVIDQFEELFTLVGDEATRHQFLDNLVTAILDPRSRLRLVITLRADFTGQPLRYVDFGELIRQRTEFVLPLTPDELELAIVKPTERAGLSLESGLVSAIIREIGDQPGTLPLLQYALTELFERRQGRILTMAAFRESGGVLGALTRRADELYKNLSDDDRAVTRRLFSRLVTLGEGGSDGSSSPNTRRRVLRNELISRAAEPPLQPSPFEGEGANSPPLAGEGLGEGSAMQTIINTFGHYRLLTFDHDPVTRGPTVEVAHEALIREWGRLRRWLKEDREFLLWQQRLRAGLHQWKTSDHDEGALLRGAPLVEAEMWHNQRRADLNEAERSFIQASLALRQQRAAEREARRQRELEAAQKLAQTEARAAANLRQRAVWLTAAGGIAVLLAIVAGIFGMQSRQNAQEALTAQQTAEYESRRAKSGQLVLQAQAMLNNKNIPAGNSPSPDAMSHISRLVSDLAEDPSGSLSLLLARQAVLTTLVPDGYFTFEADATLRQVIEAMPPWRMTLPHPNTVNSVAFSPDGQRIVTAGLDGSVRVWDLAKGEEIIITYSHTQLGQSQQAFYSAIYSPDGKIIAMVNHDGAIELRDAETMGQTLHRFEGHTGPIFWAAFSSDSQSLISTSLDGTARLWDVASGEEIRHFKSKERINQAVFSPDNKTIITAGDETIVRMFDVTSGEEIRQFVGHTYVVNGVAISPDGQTIATASFDGTARLWDVQTGRELQIFEGHTGEVISVAFSPDGQLIATAGGDKTARLWDVATGKEIDRLEGHTATIVSVAFSPDGQTIATASDDRTVRLWEVNPGIKRHHIQSRGEIKSIAINPDSSTLVLASNLPSGEASIWNLKTGQNVRRLEGHTGEVTAVDISPNGQLIATAGSDKTVRLWNSATGVEIKRLAGHEDYIFDVAFSPNGKWVVTASADRTARVWDTASGAEIARFAGHTDQVRSAAFSPNGQTVVTAGGFRDPTARLWDVASGEQIHVLQGHTDILNSAHFSPDGKTIVTASGDGTVRLWDAATGHEIRQFAGHKRGVNSAIFSPDGQSLVTAGFDQTARVWNVTTGEEIRRLEGHTAPVNVAIFSPDGQTVISASDDNTVRIWPSIEVLLQEAKSLIQRTPPEFTPEERIRFELAGE